MVCPFPGLPSKHNEPHYSGLLAATMAGLFCRDTVKLSVKKKQKKQNTEGRKEGKKTEAEKKKSAVHRSRVNTARGESRGPAAGTRVGHMHAAAIKKDVGHMFDHN